MNDKRVDCRQRRNNEREQSVLPNHNHESTTQIQRICLESEGERKSKYGDGGKQAKVNIEH